MSHPALESATGSPVRFYALGTLGLRELPVPPRARTAHELFDELPLGVYSALRTFEHVRFLGLDRHLARTDRSMELLGWSERLDRPRLLAALDQAAAGYPGADSFVRFDVLAEPPRTLGIQERTLLALAPLVPVPPAFLHEGVAVRFSPLRRARPLIKTAAFVLERRPYPLQVPEAYEHLIVDERGRILEGTSSNFVALHRGRLRLAGDEALQGVTQAILAELAAGLGLESVRSPVSRDELGEISEAFLTGSTRGIVPVIAVEDQGIGSGRPGPWTRRLMDAYSAHALRAARRAIELTA